MDSFFRTREQWLTAAAYAMSPWLAELGTPLPPVRLSVGWPGGRRSRGATIGQCWAPSAASDGVQQIYVSPVLDDPAKVLSTLAHELCHAADRCEHGHRGLFARLARGIGLEGPLPATHAGDALTAQLAAVATSLGAYPHSALVSVGAGSAHPKQTTRMIKTECPACGYVARTSRKWLDQSGAPICPVDDLRMEIDS